MSFTKTFIRKTISRSVRNMGRKRVKMIKKRNRREKTDSFN
jgi:hypothetical protein